MVKIKLPENLLTEEEKKELQQAVLQGGQIEKNSPLRLYDNFNYSIDNFHYNGLSNKF